MNKQMIGDKIAITRKKNNVSQKQLAELITVNYSLLGRWERGESLPSLKALLKISEIFNLDDEYFVEKVYLNEYISASETTRPKGRWSQGKVKSSFLERDDISKVSLINVDFSKGKILNKIFYKFDLSDLDFTKSDMKGSSFKQNKMHRANFRQCNITDCIFINNSLNSANFEESILTQTHFNTSEFNSTVFTSTNFINTNFSRLDLTQAIFKNCEFNGVLFKSVNMSGMCFEGQSFNNVKFDDTVLKDCSFKNAKLINVSFRPDFAIKYRDYKILKTLCFDGAIMDSLTYTSLKYAGVTLSDIDLIS